MVLICYSSSNHDIDVFDEAIIKILRDGRPREFQRIRARGASRGQVDPSSSIPCLGGAVTEPQDSLGSPWRCRDSVLPESEADLRTREGRILQEGEG